jgi:hypothetical protein
LVEGFILSPPFMSEPRSIRVADPDLDNWIDETIEKGDFSPLVEKLLLRYRQEQDQEYAEEKKLVLIDRKITIFQGIMWISVASWMLVFSLSRFYDALSILATYLLMLSGVLLCIYVLIIYFKNNSINPKI